MAEKEKIEVTKKESKEEENKEGKKSRELTVRRENPFSLFQEMDRMFDSFFNDEFWPFGWTRRRRPFSLIIKDDEPIFRTPLSNITETENTFEILAELPGMDKSEINLTITDNVLEIRGEQKEEKKEEKEGEYVRRECRSTSFYRAFNLPENIDEEKIDANLNKGILKVSIPKVEPPKPEKKQIEIK
ncbi:MAG: Hsp20/alpha crystallin family protein [Promethearchaeota archaeon]|nr:MAG: Hsp20/alpha crystallin family protein [Candidatus Lokiarchaeota archaeon]